MYVVRLVWHVLGMTAAGVAAGLFFEIPIAEVFWLALAASLLPTLLWLYGENSADAHGHKVASLFSWLGVLAFAAALIEAFAYAEHLSVLRDLAVHLGSGLFLQIGAALCVRAWSTRRWFGWFAATEVVRFGLMALLAATPMREALWRAEARRVAERHATFVEAELFAEHVLRAEAERASLFRLIPIEKHAAHAIIDDDDPVVREIGTWLRSIGIEHVEQGRNHRKRSVVQQRRDEVEDYTVAVTIYGGARDLEETLRKLLKSHGEIPSIRHYPESSKRQIDLFRKPDRLGG